MLIDAELLQELFAHVSAVGRAIRLQLRLVGTSKFAGGDFVSGHAGDGLARAGISAGASQELGDVENHERQDDEGQAPFEPAAVLAHAIEHCHNTPDFR